MVFTNVSPYQGVMTPITNISPLTYRDGATFLEYLETIKQWLNETLVPDTNTALSNAVAEFDKIRAGWDARYDYLMEDLTAQIALLNEAAVADLVDTGTVHTRIMALIDAAITAASAADRAYTDTVTAPLADNGYMVATFTGNGAEGEKLSLFYSADGKTVTGGSGNPAYTPADNQGVRDPSLIRYNGKWYVTHTSNNGIDKDFQIAVSDSGAPGTWSQVATISGAGLPDVNKIWAPEFVVAPDGVYIFFSRIRQSNQATGSMFWIKAGNTDLTAWGTPQAMSWTAEPTHYIDGVPVQHTDGKWYLFYSNGSDIERAVSDTLTGTYTRDKAGNWAGWGTGIEGPYLTKDKGKYRIYFDRYQAGSGVAWSESADLTTWTPAQNIVIVPGTLRPGQTIRHGSFYKLSERVGGAQAVAAHLPGARVRHVELTSVPGTTGGNGAVVTMKGWAVDSNESTDTSFIDYDPTTGFLTLKEYGVYAFGGNTGASNVTGVDRSWAALASVDLPVETIHMRTPGGAEDLFPLAVPNFKTNHAGERVKVYVFSHWTGAETTANYPMRLRITKLQ